MSSEQDFNDMPELTAEQQAKLNSMPKDLVDRLWNLETRVSEALDKTETGGMSVDELTTHIINSDERLKGITFGIVREAVQNWRLPKGAVSGQ